MRNARAALGEDYGFCSRQETAGKASKWAQLRTAKALLPEIDRFQACHHATRRGPMRQAGVEVYVKQNAAWFKGVMQCGSVWICPICARRIAERRREELQEAIDNSIRKECGVILVTLTFPHGAGDVLADILDRFAKAQRAFKSGRAATLLRDRIGYMGEVRTIEVTHGVNGWHPHAHSIWLTRRKLTQAEQAELADDLYEHWRRAALRAGLPEPSREHGVDVRGARYASEYVAKWGFAMELAGHTSKRGKLAGRTPWQLLAEATEGDKRAAWLWREFALAFFGRRQLLWSRGLRDELAMTPELTDQMLLELPEERAVQVAVLDLDTWYAITKAQAQEQVLEAALAGRYELYALLNHLRSTVPKVDGRPPGPREDWVL